MTLLNANGRPAGAVLDPSGVPTAPLAGGLQRTRSPRFVLVGVLLVLAGALLFYVTSVRVDPRTPVLAVAGSVPVGHVLTDADLMVVRIVSDPALGALPDSQRSSVVGRTVRQPLAAHTLLSQAMLGPAAWPPAGQSLIAVPVKAGHAPTGLAAGAQVLVLVVPSASGVGSANSSSATPVEVVQAFAAVVSVGAPDGTGGVVVSLLVASPDAARIVSASGDVSLVEQGG
ncbi:SAF domain-containing protein [Rugosimonospora africana]|uniref:SAF domain-containing protein n=1 Tax=Rugosimonospora africana TaxID=556532 RepID=A0A8J3QTB9_9ACTN|nr:SAF domain-containing protein [Rugosimonospora africana]GIH16096.1 hypothetical protein Raf01_42680 [Rugosimonospora africana]